MAELAGDDENALCKQTAGDLKIITLQCNKEQESELQPHRTDATDASNASDPWGLLDDEMDEMLASDSVQYDLDDNLQDSHAYEESKRSSNHRREAAAARGQQQGVSGGAAGGARRKQGGPTHRHSSC